jgi:hypothetical protein
MALIILIVVPASRSLFLGEHGGIGAFVYVIANVIDVFDGVAEFDVDVSVEWFSEQRAVGKDQAVADVEYGVKTAVLRTASPVGRVAVLFDLRFSPEWLRVLPALVVTRHARGGVVEGDA